MNCRLCRAYGREKNACPGCRGDDSLKWSEVFVTVTGEVVEQFRAARTGERLERYFLERRAG